MPRSSRPQRYPNKCYRLASIMESHEQPFHIDLPTQRLAIDLRQELYSFAKACERESEREERRRNMKAAGRWHSLFTTILRWELQLEPSYDRDNLALLDYPARLNFRLKDHIPKNALVDAQLDALEGLKSDSDNPPKTLDTLLRDMGITPDTDKG